MDDGHALGFPSAVAAPAGALETADRQYDSYLPALSAPGPVRPVARPGPVPSLLGAQNRRGPCRPVLPVCGRGELAFVGRTLCIRFGRGPAPAADLAHTRCGTRSLAAGIRAGLALCPCYSHRRIVPPNANVSFSVPAFLPTRPYPALGSGPLSISAWVAAGGGAASGHASFSSTHVALPPAGG